MSKVDIVQDYLNRGWVPFSYEHQYSPGNNWQHSKVSPDTLAKVVESDTPVGLLLGDPSKLVVVDIDPRNGGDLQAVLSHYKIKKTRVHSTPSKGWHLLFRYEGSLKKTTGDKTGIPALKGVDLLANGSNIIAPPTARVNHPKGKPDGQYTVIVDAEPSLLPEELRLDWESALVTELPDNVEGAEVSPENYDWVLQIHKQNVEIAARAPEGSRDDTCIARIGASMRIAVAVPDDVLSIEKVRDDFESNLPYVVTDLKGKVARAVEWAKARAWVEPPRDEGSVLPEGVAPEMAAEYWEALARLRVREAAKDTFRIERIESDARKVRFGDFVEGREFRTKRPDTPRWVIENLIHHGGSSLLVGQYKAGKSTLMLNMIQALTTGGSFLGSFGVPHPLKVAYVDLELGRSLAWDWFDEIPDVNFGNLVYVPRVGQGAQLNMQSETIRSKWARRLRTAGVDVLIIDPLSPVMSGVGIDENSAETVRPMLDSFDVLKVEAGLQALIVTHHTGHQNAGRARGSTAFLDWCSSFMAITKQGEDETSPRAFRAFGRDVSVASSPLVFDAKTKTTKLSTAVYNPPASNPF